MFILSYTNIHELHLKVYVILFKIDKKRLSTLMKLFSTKFLNYNVKYHVKVRFTFSLAGLLLKISAKREKEKRETERK